MASQTRGTGKLGRDDQQRTLVWGTPCLVCGMPFTLRVLRVSLRKWPPATLDRAA